jgi:hypothetical protein
MFTVSRVDSGFDADTFEPARKLLAGEASARYGGDEIRAEPFPSRQTSRQWGHLIRHPDARIVDEQHRWALENR